MKRLIILLFIILSIPTIYALGETLAVPKTEELGVQYVPTPNITFDPARSYTVIEAVVENSGYEKIFLSLPKDWEIDPQILSATGEPIIVSKGKLYKKYGHPDDRYSFISNNYVLWQTGGFSIGRGSPYSVSWADGGTSYGWFINPNERFRFKIKLIPSETESVIDFLAIEQNRSDIKVMKWNQDFYIYPEPSLGYISAPWILKNATLVEAYPGIVGNLSAYPGGYYYHQFLLDEQKKEEEDTWETVVLDPPGWDEWFTDEGMSFGLVGGSLAEPKSEFESIPVIEKTVLEKEESTDEVFVPVWYHDFGINFMRYRYEWKRGQTIEGIDQNLYLDRPLTKTELYGEDRFTYTPPEPVAEKPELDLTRVPEWFSWF